MRCRVLNVGGKAGTDILAAEYELFDGGTSFARDYVVYRVRPGETWAQIQPLALELLDQRTAVWEISNETRRANLRERKFGSLNPPFLELFPDPPPIDIPSFPPERNFNTSQANTKNNSIGGIDD